MRVKIIFIRKATSQDILAVERVIFEISDLQSKRCDLPGQSPCVTVSGKKKILGKVRDNLIKRTSSMSGVRKVSWS